MSGPKKNNNPFDSKKFKQGIAYVESNGGKNTWNKTSSATGKYQFLYNEIKHLPEMAGITREQFNNNPDLQEKIMDMAINNKIKNRPGYYRNARDLTNDYRDALGERWNYRPDEVAALTHFLGRKGARDYFRSMIDGSDYEVPGRNMGVSDYLDKYNKGIGSKRGYAVSNFPANKRTEIPSQKELKFKTQDTTDPSSIYKAPKLGPQVMPEQLKKPQRKASESMTDYLINYLNNNEFKEGGMLTEFNVGGSHAENPFGGIPQGVGANGKLNTVQEGETKKDNYVFSDDIYLTPEMAEKHGLHKKYIGKSYAKISKVFTQAGNKIDEESNEEMLGRAESAQENERMARKIKDANMAFFGGEQAAITGAAGTGTPHLMLAQKGMELIGNIGSAVTSNFGADNIEASGNTRPEKEKFGETLLSNIGKDPITGAMNILGFGARNKAYKKAIKSNDLKQNAKFNNNFEKGGKMYDTGGPLINFNVDEFVKSLQVPGIPNLTGTSDDYHTDTSTTLWNPAGVKDPTPWDGKTATPSFNFTEPKKERKTDFGDIANDALRFAPAANNLIQALSLKKPEQESLGRIDKRYKPDMIDERGLLNRATSDYNNVANSLRGTNVGSGGLRTDLLMAHLNRQKGLSDAFFQVDNINRGENRFGQQFNLNVDTTNLRQSNLEKDMNARNRAAYDNNKSRLWSAFSENLGGIGLENMRKKYPERLDLYYDWKGKYRNV